VVDALSSSERRGENSSEFSAEIPGIRKSQTDKERRAMSAYIEEVYLQAEREELIAQTYAVKLENRCKRPSPTKADRIVRFQP
jgi:hypothetical protein